jgi:hypothetical protein
MTDDNLNLTQIFGAVTQALSDNQQNLNRADEFNRNHGDNMVQTFQTITQALEKKQTSSNSAALAYAARQLGRTTTSTSGKLYADHLSQAATQMKGRGLDTQTALSLLQTLIGGNQPPANSQSGGADILGALMGSMSGGGESGSQAANPTADLLGALLGGGSGNSSSDNPSPAGGSDPLSALLGGLVGGSAPSEVTPQAGGDPLGALLGGGSASGGTSQLPQNQSEFKLLNAGLAFLQAKQSGQGNTQALLQAFMAGSGMGNTSHRQQSTQMVIQSFLQALSGMSNN